jgi:hypothetical protein
MRKMMKISKSFWQALVWKNNPSWQETTRSTATSVASDNQSSVAATNTQQNDQQGLQDAIVVMTPNC